MKTDFIDADRRPDFGHCLQSDQPGPWRPLQSLESGRDQDAVFAGQRNEIGDGAQRHQIEQWTKIKVLRPGQTGFASPLHQCVREFERQPDRAEFREGACPTLRIHQGRRGGRWIGNLMMIQYDDINSALAKPVNRGNCRGPAIDRQQQLDGKSPQTIFDPVLAQTVAFIQTVRQVMVHSPAERG